MVEWHASKQIKYFDKKKKKLIFSAYSLKSVNGHAGKQHLLKYIFCNNVLFSDVS